MNSVLAVVLAYLVGSVSFAILVSRIFRLQDPRQHGSGNPGATNVLRTGNKAAAGLTLLGDGLKGFIVVWLAIHFGSEFGLARITPALVALAVFAAIYGLFFIDFEAVRGSQPRRVSCWR